MTKSICINIAPKADAKQDNANGTKSHFVTRYTIHRLLVQKCGLMRFASAELLLAHREGEVYNNLCGAWRSLVARSVRDAEVGGSNPLAPTFFLSEDPKDTPNELSHINFTPYFHHVKI